MIGHLLWDAVTSVRVELTGGEETLSSLQSPLWVHVVPQDDPLSQGQKLSGTVQREEKKITFLSSLFCACHSDAVGRGCVAPGGCCGAVPRPVWQTLWLSVPSGAEGNELRTNASS